MRVGNHASYDESARVLLETDVLAYGAQVVTPSSTGVVVSVTDTDTVLFEFDCSGLRSLGVRPRSVSGEKTVTWFSGYRYYGGFEYQRTTGGYISVINVLDIEDYVKCVIAAEMSNDWPLEALKAQTVCARTYAASQTRHRSAGFDVCSTVDCQAYKGMAPSNERSDAAAEETRGVYLYYNGELVTNAVYYSCNGGASESCKNVWGSEVRHICRASSILTRQASRGASPATTGRSLRPATSCARCSESEANTDIGQVQNVYVSEYSDTGNVIAVTYEGDPGRKLHRAAREVPHAPPPRVRPYQPAQYALYLTGGDASTYYVNDAQSSVTGTGAVCDRRRRHSVRRTMPARRIPTSLHRAACPPPNTR